jgi:hypothetical protein
MKGSPSSYHLKRNSNKNKMINNVEITEHLTKLIICIYKYKYFISTNSSTING